MLGVGPEHVFFWDPVQLAAPMKTVRLVLPGVSWEAGLEMDKNLVSGSILTWGLWRGGKGREGQSSIGQGEELGSSAWGLCPGHGAEMVLHRYLSWCEGTCHWRGAALGRGHGLGHLPRAISGGLTAGSQQQQGGNSLALKWRKLGSKPGICGTALNPCPIISKAIDRTYGGWLKKKKKGTIVGDENR